MFVYADNAATTCVSKTALDAMMPYLTEQIRQPLEPVCLCSEFKGSA